VCLRRAHRAWWAGVGGSKGWWWVVGRIDIIFVSPFFSAVSVADCCVPTFIVLYYRVCGLGGAGFFWLHSRQTTIFYNQQVGGIALLKTQPQPIIIETICTICQQTLSA